MTLVAAGLLGAAPAAAADDTCKGWQSLPDSGSTTLSFVRALAGQVGEYELKSKIRWNSQHQIDCYATSGARVNWAFEQSNRYKGGDLWKMDPKMSNLKHDLPTDAGVYFDTNAIDGGDDTGMSYGILRPNLLEAGRDYTISYRVQLPKNSTPARISVTGQVVEKNCDSVNAWCVGGVPGLDTKAEDVYIGFGDDAKPRLWGPRGTTCWQWKKNADPTFAPWPCKTVTVPTNGGSVGTPVVPNKLPVPVISATRVNGGGNRVILNGLGSTDPDGSIAAYEWSSGGKVISTSPSATVEFPGQTSAKVSLKVTDNRKGVASASTTVSLANRPPTILRPNPVDGAVVGTNRPPLSTTVSDPDGDDLTFNYRITGHMVDKSSGPIKGGWTVPASTLDPGQKYRWSVTVTDGRGGSASAERTLTVAMLPTAADVISTPSGNGYWQVASDGGVFSFGDAQFYGSVPGIPLKLDNIMGMARTPSGRGYWVVGSDGGVFSFGDAQFYGSVPGNGTRVNNIVDMVPTKTGRGYWLVGSDGGVFTFGDAQFFGSKGGEPLNKPVVSMSATASGNGYWLAAADGGVFTFGDAQFYGSMGDKHLSYPVTDMDVTPDGGGYWMTAEDGGVFTFGNAGFFGSLGSVPLNGRITGMSATPTGRGYWLTGCDGGIFTFGDARFYDAGQTYGCRGTNQP